VASLPQIKKQRDKGIVASLPQMEDQ